MSSDQYYPAGDNNNPIKSLSSASKTSNQSGFPAYEINFINPHASYYALNFIDIISKGKDYPYSTTPYIASPEHPNGNPCSVSISFGLNVSSILMTSGGINHSVGDLYSIFNSQKNNDPAILRVLEVDTNGTITSFSIQDSGSGFNNDGIYVVCKSYSVNSYDDCATFSLVQDKFCIADIVIDDGGSGYDYFDNEGIVQNRQIVLSNSGGGYGFLAHISTQPVLINNEFKFPPKTHTSLDESNIVISNGIGSSSSSLYSYVLTNCENPVFQYKILGTNINLEINKAYKLNTFELDYGIEEPVDTDRCYLVSNYDFNFYSELSSIQVASGPYDSCENCLSPSPSSTPTPTPPAPTPPYVLSSSSSSSFSLCGQEKDSSNSELYLLAAILSAAGGTLSAYGAYKILDKY
ncbi:hypothetical protein EB001_16680, partial [bacterium]|nr:hypothetical protein [bacterium]